MSGALSVTDPEVAAFTLARHLEELWATGRPDRDGWELIPLDALHWVVSLPGRRADGSRDPYYVRLGGKYYDLHAPTVAFVEPREYQEAHEGTRWFPRINPAPPWFGLHSTYGYSDGTRRQLVCFSFSADYYMTGHSPGESIRWQQGRHTVAATLYRLAEVLGPPWYQGPSE